MDGYENEAKDENDNDLYVLVSVLAVVRSAHPVVMQFLIQEQPKFLAHKVKSMHSTHN